MGGVPSSYQNIQYNSWGQSVAFQAFWQLPIPKFPRKVFMAGFHLFPVVQYHPGVEEPELIKWDYSIGRFALEFYEPVTFLWKPGLPEGLTSETICRRFRQ